MLILYGIKNCDACQKSSKWLEINGFNFTFHDFRKNGLDETILDSWSDLIDLESCLNRRSTSWRKLSESEKSAVNNDLIGSFLLFPTLIKRPVLHSKYSIILGFDHEKYKMILK